MNNIKYTITHIHPHTVYIYYAHMHHYVLMYNYVHKYPQVSS